MLVTVPLSPVVTILPVVAGNVITVPVPAAAVAINVIVPLVLPGSPILVPTKSFLAIAAPPLTVNAPPVDLSVASVVDPIVATSSTVNPFLTLKLLFAIWFHSPPILLCLYYY